MTKAEELVIVIGGPAGTGKTTIGSKLAELLHCPFLEGDSFHSKANIDKMAQGIPLTDEDRYPWLTTLTENAVETSTNDPSSISVVSCSMLKKEYRKFIKSIGSHSSNIDENVEVKFLFIFLYTDYQALLNRVAQRQDHYMKSDMVKSQYDIMEIPAEKDLIEEGGDEYGINTTGRSIEDILEEVYDVIKDELHA
ncbi:unnamed protein product [Kuraishia capsulata CBS 1993]|uniref:Gluconokinase n=1 Tax=Kuraishia capsulata CBS 1993 TaxID=1382522 RepID=W6MME1_9ASCO|nr:uncharacterized protein KUCA_T00003690001 [Kuraishia capsulata CBS 1993]CDK27711.1 unnamed protein product [Kuraishia capsulata CBS 1993]